MDNNSSLKFGFFNSKNGDRMYEADAFSNFLEGLINDGIYDTIGDKFHVKPADGQTAENLAVTVGTGRAYFNHKWIENPAAERINLEDDSFVSSGFGRTDVIYLVVDSSARECRIGRSKGKEYSLSTTTNYDAAAEVPEDTSTLKYHALAYLRLVNGLTSIETDRITNRIGIPLEEGKASNTVSPYVAAVVKQIDITDYVAQWNAEWSKFVSGWSNTMSDQIEVLSENASQAAIASGYQLINKQYVVDIPDADWIESDDPEYDDYPFSYTIPVPGLLGNEVVEIRFDAKDVMSGLFAGFCKVVVNPSGIVIYASDQPDHTDIYDAEDATVMTNVNIIVTAGAPIVTVTYSEE